MIRRALPALMFALPIVAIAAPASAQELIRYTTRDGDTCPAIVQRVYGSATRIDVIHTYNTMGAMPHRFRAGRVLVLPRVPPPPRPSSDAEVAAVRNDVHAYTPGDHRARNAEPLNRGHRVGTLAASSAAVVMGDERVVQLEEHTLVVVLGRYSLQTQRRGTAEDTQLVSGTLRSSLGALAGRATPQPIVVQTPAARVSASSGTTAVTVDAHRATQVAVESGSAEVSVRRRRVVVPAGFGSRTEMGQAPSPPQPLPARPRWVHVPPSLTLLTAGPANALAEYGAGDTAGAPPATHWRVQLARDADFRQLIIDRRVDAGVTSFEARDLPAGTFHLRVRAVDAANVESQPSPPVEFRVVSPRLIAALPGHRAAVEFEDGLFCSVDGGDRIEVHGPVEVRPARDHVIRCSLATDSTDVVEYPVSAANSGSITGLARASDAAWDGDEGVRTIVVRTMDPAGEAMPDVEVTGVWNGTGSLSAFTRTREPGTMAARIRWTGAIAASVLRVRAGETELATIEIAAAQPPEPSPPVPGVPPVARRRRPLVADPPPRFDAGFGISVVPTFTRLGTGFDASASARYRVPFSWGEFSIGLRIGYSRFACDGGTATAADFCARPPSAASDPRIAEDLFTAGVPVGVGLRIARRWVPYLSVIPQLGVGRVSITPTNTPLAAPRVTFGVTGVIGLQFEARPHAPFVELGYRYMTLGDDRLGTLAAGGLIGTVGYRVFF